MHMEKQETLAETLKRFAEDVKGFMLACDQEVSSAYVEKNATSELALKLIEEEWGEFQTAIKNKDKLEAFDGALDSIWVNIKYLLATGQDHLLSFDAIAEKTLLKTAKSLDEETTEYEIKIPDIMLNFDQQLCKDLELLEPKFSGMKKIALCALVRIAFCLHYCTILKWDWKAGWEEVKRSNYAKINPVTGKVEKNEYGKVMKPEGWTKPQLETFLKL